MDHDPRPDPQGSQQSALASKSSTVVQAARDATVVNVQLSVVAAVVVVAVVMVSLVVILVPKSLPRSGEVPLSEFTPIGTRVLTDDIDTVDMKDGTRVKVAHLSCTEGTPPLLTETYDLDAGYVAFIGRVSVDDDPAGKPVIFSLVADGTEIATETVEVKQTLHIRADLTGVRTLSLQTTTATCANVDAAWVESTLMASGG